MGYILKSLQSVQLSTESRYRYYVLFLSCEHSALLESWMERYFTTIAKGFGDKAAIVKGMEAGQLKGDFLEFAQRHRFWDAPNEPEATNCRTTREAIASLPDEAHFKPLLVVIRANAGTPAHGYYPWRFIPLERIDSEVRFVGLMKQLTDAIASDRFEYLDSFSHDLDNHKRFSLTDAVALASDAVEIKPGAFGISVDLKKLWTGLVSKERKS